MESRSATRKPSRLWPDGVVRSQSPQHASARWRQGNVAKTLISGRNTPTTAYFLALCDPGVGVTGPDFDFRGVEVPGPAVGCPCALSAETRLPTARAIRLPDRSCRLRRRPKGKVSLWPLRSPFLRMLGLSSPLSPAGYPRKLDRTSSLRCFLHQLVQLGLRRAEPTIASAESEWFARRLHLRGHQRIAPFICPKRPAVRLSQISQFSARVFRDSGPTVGFDKSAGWSTVDSPGSGANIAVRLIRSSRTTTAA